MVEVTGKEPVEQEFGRSRELLGKAEQELGKQFLRTDGDCRRKFRVWRQIRTDILQDGKADGNLHLLL